VLFRPFENAEDDDSSAEDLFYSLVESGKYTQKLWLVAIAGLLRASKFTQAYELGVQLRRDFKTLDDDSYQAVLMTCLQIRPAAEETLSVFKQYLDVSREPVEAHVWTGVLTALQDNTKGALRGGARKRLVPSDERRL
jgi:hypothetical protein